MARIILVEDEINIASFIERGLIEFGHEVCVAHDGVEAWELIRKEKFQLLIFDIIMPGMPAGTGRAALTAVFLQILRLPPLRQLHIQQYQQKNRKAARAGSFHHPAALPRDEVSDP